MDATTCSVGAKKAEPPLREFLLYFLHLGALGFGGPIALAGHMQKGLVEEPGWVSRQDYMEGLAFSQLSPGPLAAQLAMKLGWVMARSDPCRSSIYTAFTPDGDRAGSAIGPHRRDSVDSRSILWSGRRGDCHHRKECIQTGALDPQR